MDQTREDNGVIELAQVALEASKEHLATLKTYTQGLEAELAKCDKLLDAVDSIDESDLDMGSSVTIPGSVRATAPIATKELLIPESPFYEDALKRSRYQSFSEVHPMKPKELEALAEAVRAESCRKHALDIQRRGLSAFPNIDVQTPDLFGLNAEDIDWDRAAERVSAISMTARSARECEIRWLGEQHPKFNHEPWNQDEIKKVKSLAAEYLDSQVDWVAIAEKLGTRRTPLDCMRHATSRKAHQWTKEADERLLKAIRMYGHDNWYLVARYVSEDATPAQCSSRFQKTLDDSIKRTSWSPEEDARLSAAVAVYGSSWVDVAANVPGRHNDQCRDRWTEQLNPSINKSPWSDEEDRSLLDYVREHKDASWREISEHLRNGRTEAMCRNRYAVLQRSANTVPATTAVSSGSDQVASVCQVVSSDSVSTSSNSLQFKLSFPDLHRCPTISAPPEHHQPQQFVFLEPVVNSDPESYKYLRPRSSQPITRSKTTTNGIPSSTTTTAPPSKRRKTQSRTAGSKKPSMAAQQDSRS